MKSESMPTFFFLGGGGSGSSKVLSYIGTGDFFSDWDNLI